MKQVAMLFVTCALIFFAEYSSAKYLLVDIDDGYNGKIYISCQLKSKHAVLAMPSTAKYQNQFYF